MEFVYLVLIDRFICESFGSDRTGHGTILDRVTEKPPADDTAHYDLAAAEADQATIAYFMVSPRSTN
jgi:hypothetical protein